MLSAVQATVTYSQKVGAKLKAKLIRKKKLRIVNKTSAHFFQLLFSLRFFFVDAWIILSIHNQATTTTTM